MSSTLSWSIIPDAFYGYHCCCPKPNVICASKKVNPFVCFAFLLVSLHSSQAVMAQLLMPSPMVSLSRSIFQKEYKDRAAPAALR